MMKSSVLVLFGKKPPEPEKKIVAQEKPVIQPRPMQPPSPQPAVVKAPEPPAVKPASSVTIKTEEKKPVEPVTIKQEKKKGWPWMWIGIGGAVVVGGTVAILALSGGKTAEQDLPDPPPIPTAKHSKYIYIIQLKF